MTSVTNTGEVEETVRGYYNAAIDAYAVMMPQDAWHHGDERAHNAGLSSEEAALDMQRQLVAATGITAGDLVLDFGSGVGGAVVNMAEMSGARFVGISNNDALTAKAQRLAASRGLADKAFFHSVGDTEYRTLGAWPDAAFAAITYQESVVHLPDKQAFFNAAFRVLRPGGTLAAVDWIQRPWGEHRSPEQIEAVMAEVNRGFCIPHHATVEQYRDMLVSAGFDVREAVDLFPSGPCWGSTPEEERDKWLTYEGARNDLFHDSKIALDAARAAGVFSVAKLVATKPA
ncbi:methyltransferase domain-containing protein [Amycolatopsis sp. NPDC049253]|uniref:SAM-dependent methyltransferase n=1 Tax=Amycolatopsis sp. NPDC049253 TaxID=3155274 RepID=UPI0034142ED1